ncbi:MAG: ribosomal-protein-alanine N-acetyltransferase [Lysobacterales bacterium]|jgi:ribosomal-protein-alanine N-acetyltransferase
MTVSLPYKILETARTRLRPLSSEDAEAMFELYSDPETMKYWSSEPVTDIAGAQKLVQADIDWVKGENALLWAVTLPPSDKVLGKCVLFQLNHQNRRAELGYVINRSQWGQGLMTEVLEAVIPYAFESLNLHRIEVDTDPENVGSLRMLDKLGFRSEGLFKDRWFVHGQWHDSAMLALLKPEWQNRLI